MTGRGVRRPTVPARPAVELQQEVPAGPVRTCVGCRQRSERSRLLRVVAAGSGAERAAVPDPRGRLPGRGAWLHLDLGCFEAAVRRRAFVRALREQGPLDLAAVRDHLEQHAGPPPHRRAGSGSASDGHPMSTQR